MPSHATVRPIGRLSAGASIANSAVGEKLLSDAQPFGFLGEALLSDAQPFGLLGTVLSQLAGFELGHSRRGVPFALTSNLVGTRTDAQGVVFLGVDQERFAIWRDRHH